MNLKKISTLVLVLAILVGTLLISAHAESIDSVGMKVTANASVYLRTGAGLNYSKVTTAHKGDSLTYKGVTKFDSRDVAWHKVTYKNKTAWISSRYSTLEFSGKKLDGKTSVISTAAVNLRKGAGTGYAKITTVSKGTRLFYYGIRQKDKSGTYWYQVSCSQGVAWVCGKYVKVSNVKPRYDDDDDPEYTEVETTGKVYLRSKADLTGKILDVIPKGETVDFLGKISTDGRGIDWYKVEYDGTTGWVSSTWAKLVK